MFISFCRCDEVIGLDFSESFIRYADAMKENGELAYTMVEEGEIVTERLACRPKVDTSRISFVQACKIIIYTHYIFSLYIPWTNFLLPLSLSLPLSPSLFSISLCLTFGI